VTDFAVTNAAELSPDGARTRADNLRAEIIRVLTPHFYYLRYIRYRIFLSTVTSFFTRQVTIVIAAWRYD
jgi:hypothetical protein